MVKANIESDKKERRSNKNVLDNLIERYPLYQQVLNTGKHVFLSFKNFSTRKELNYLIQLVECMLSSFATTYKMFDYVEEADKCLDYIWGKRSTYKDAEHGGGDFLPWLEACVKNYGRDHIKDALEIVDFDSSDVSDDGGSINFGYHGERNRISEKAQFTCRAYQMDFLSEESARELEEEYNRRKTELHESHSRQLRAEKVAFDKALNRVLSELRPQARLLYDLYNQEVSFNEIYLKINAGSPVAARVRRNELVKSMEKKMVKYWAAPKGYHYDDPLEPMRRLLMEITFFKGRSVNVTKQLRVK